MPSTCSVFLLVFLLLPVQTLHAQSALPLATGEWAPFTSRSLPQGGAVTALVQEVFSRMGREPEISFYPWKRCYSLVLQGEVFGAFPYSWTKQRSQEVLFSEPISYSDTGWFHVGPPPITAYTGLDELQGLRIAGVVGYFYQEALDEAGLQVEYAPDEASAFRMLLAGRVDLVPMNVLVASGIIERHFPDQGKAIKQLKGLYSRNDLRLIVSRDYPGARELLAEFNKALSEAGPVLPENTPPSKASD